MKKQTLNSIIIAMLVLHVSSVYSQSVGKSILLTIDEGESIAYGESCIPMTTSPDSLYVVTKKGANIYVYENGRKTGPYTSFDDANIKDCGNDDQSLECATFTYENNEGMETYVSYDDDGNIVIKFKGKTYGPYPQIYFFAASIDNQSFTAVVADENTKSRLITSSGTDKLIDGIPSDFAVSPSAKKVIITVSVPPDEAYTKAMNELSNIDYDKMSPEDIQKLAKKVQESGINSYQEKVYLLTSDNQKFGPYIKDSITGPQFCKTGEDNWYILVGDKMYVDGKEFANFKAPTAAPCDIWLSGDGKRYAALVNYEKIIFSDGTSYQYPLEIRAGKVNGKTVLKWVSFENSRDLILYTKFL